MLAVNLVYGQVQTKNRVNITGKEKYIIFACDVY